MQNKIFGEIAFKTGWKTKTEITLWSKKFMVEVKADAYSEHEGITSEQETSFASFKTLQTKNQSTIESLLSEYFNGELNTEQLIENLTPTTLLIKRHGGCALLFDDEADPDNGIAVCLSPNEEVMAQDEYL